MKKFFGLVCAAMFAISTSAQVTWNVKAGAGLSWAPISVSGNEYRMESKSHFVGKLGVGVEVPVTQNFSVMPSLELAFKGAKYDGYSDEKADEADKTNIDLTYLQIPVMAAYRFSLSDRLNMTLKAGPYFAYALSGKIKGDEEPIDIFKNEVEEYNNKRYERKGNRFDAGLIAGVDFEYHRFVVGIEYEYGLTNFYEFHSSYTEGSTKYDTKETIKNSAAYITVGYKF